MNNFKKLTLKRKSNIGTLLVAFAITVTTPASLFAYSSSDMTEVADEIGDTVENPTDCGEVTSTISKKVAKQFNVESINSEGLVSAYQVNSFDTSLSSTGIGGKESVTSTVEGTENTEGTEESVAVCLTGDIVYKPATHYIHHKDCSWVDETCYSLASTDNLEISIRDIESMLTGNTDVDVTYKICSDCNPLNLSDDDTIDPEGTPNISDDDTIDPEGIPSIEDDDTIDPEDIPSIEDDDTIDTEETPTIPTIPDDDTIDTLDTSVTLDYYTPSVGDVYDGSGLIKASVSYDYEGAASEAGITDYDILLLRRIVSSEYGSDWVPIEEKAKIVAGVMNMVKSSDPWYPDTIEEVLAKSCEPWGFDRYRDYYMSDSIIMAVDYYFAHIDEFGTYKSWYGDGTWNYFHNYD